MTYYNPVFSFGPGEFCGACAASGIDGLIIPDLIPEEGQEVEVSAQKRGIDLIYLLPPTSTGKRLKLITDRSRGFVYLVSVTGITGARDSLPESLEAFVENVRAVSDKPLCVGFGISTPGQAAQVARFADGVIVGSRIVQSMEADESLAEVADFVTGLRRALDDVDGV